MTSVVRFYGEGEYKSFSPAAAIPGVAAHEAENHRSFERAAAAAGQIPGDATTQLKFAYNPATGRVEVVGGESRVQTINETPRNGQRVGPRTVIIDPSKDPNSAESLQKAKQASQAAGGRGKKARAQDPDKTMVGQLSTMRATLSTQLGKLDSELARRKNGVAPGGPVAARAAAAIPPPAPVAARPPAAATGDVPAVGVAPTAAGDGGLLPELQLHNDVRTQVAQNRALSPISGRPPAPPRPAAASTNTVANDAARRQAAQDALRMQAASQAAGPPAPSDAQVGDLESRRQDLMQRLQHVDEALNKLSEDIQKRLNGVMMGTVDAIENQAGAVAVAAVGIRPDMGGGSADLSGSPIAGGDGSTAPGPPPPVGDIPSGPPTPPAMPGLGSMTAPPPPAAPPPPTPNYSSTGLPQMAGGLGFLVNNVA